MRAVLSQSIPGRVEVPDVPPDIVCVKANEVLEVMRHEGGAQFGVNRIDDISAEYSFSDEVG